MGMTEELHRSRRRERLLSRVKTELRRAQQDRKRAQRRKDRGDDGADAALAHAEGRLRGLRLAEMLADELRDATDFAQL